MHGRRISRRRPSRRPAITRSGAGRRPGTAWPSCRATPNRSSRERRCPAIRRDDQARYIEAAVDGILVGCIYLPNGNPQPGPKFDYKLAWFKRLARACAQAAQAEASPVVLAGDYNVAPTEIDIYPTKSWDDDALVQPESRAAYAKLVKQGWTDACATASRRARLHVLALHAEPLGARCRLAPRSSAAQPAAGGTAEARRRRPRRSGQAGASDHAPLGHAEGRRTETTRASAATLMAAQANRMPNSYRRNSARRSSIRLAQGLGSRDQARRLPHPDFMCPMEGDVTHAQGAGLDAQIPETAKAAALCQIASSTAKSLRWSRRRAEIRRAAGGALRTGKTRNSSISHSTCCSIGGEDLRRDALSPAQGTAEDAAQGDSVALS